MTEVTVSQIEEIQSALAVAYAAVKCSDSPVPGWMEQIELATSIATDLQIDAILNQRMGAK